MRQPSTFGIPQPPTDRRRVVLLAGGAIAVVVVALVVVGVVAALDRSGDEDTFEPIAQETASVAIVLVPDVTTAAGESGETITPLAEASTTPGKSAAPAAAATSAAPEVATPAPATPTSSAPESGGAVDAVDSATGSPSPGATGEVLAFELDLSGIELPVTGIGIVDLFDRTVERGLGQAANGRNWGVIAGWWAVDGGTAILVQDVFERSMVVADMGSSDGEISSRMTKISPKSGLVFRFVDRNNYWVVIAVPTSSTWNIKKIVDGEIIDVASLGTVRTEADTTLSIRLDGASLEFAVDGRVVQTVFDETHRNGRQVGLTATGQLATDNAWTDFIAIPRTANS